AVRALGFQVLRHRAARHQGGRPGLRQESYVPGTFTTMTITSFSFPTPIRFGVGARREVAQHLIEQGFRRPLLVTDKSLAALPVLAEFQTHLAGLEVAVFSEVS